MSTKADLTELWLAEVGDLADTSEVRSMGELRHHHSITCLEHSLFVSYIAFRIACSWGWDTKAAARAGLMHDLYLYDSHTLPSSEQCYKHPVAALANARRICPDLTPAEENAIVSHMWPMAHHRPASTTAAAVIMADKYCTFIEACCFFRPQRLRRFLPVVRHLQTCVHD